MINNNILLIQIITLIILIIIISIVIRYFNIIEEFVTIYTTDGNTKGKYGIPCANCPGNCTSGKYITGTCSNDSTTQNKSCSPCKTTCPSGQYLSGTCTGATNTDNKTCKGCKTSCPSGQYLSGTCDGTTNTDTTICKDCRNCPSTQYKSGGCSGRSDTTCATCRSSCPGGQFLNGSCGGGWSSNNYCQNCRNCPDGSYISGGCSGRADRYCTGCITSCGANRYRAGVCGPTRSTQYSCHNMYHNCPGADWRVGSSGDYEKCQRPWPIGGTYLNKHPGAA